MKKIIVIMAILFLIDTLTVAFGEAIVTLKSGEVLRGDILSDTNDVVEIRVYSANRTISSRRSVPRSDIQGVQMETPAQAAERTDYFALSQFRLDPDQEQSSSFYTQWIAAFEKFLKDYPKSDKATMIQQHIEVCQAELKHVGAGEVKFNNQWMTPAEKKPLALTKQLTGLESRRDSLAKTVIVLQARLDGQQTKVNKLRGTTERKSNGHTDTIPNPETLPVLNDIVWCKEKIAEDENPLADLDAKIHAIKIQLPQAQ